MAEDEPFEHNVAHVVAIVVSFLIAVVQLIFGFFSYSGFGTKFNTAMTLLINMTLTFHRLLYKHPG